MVATLRTKSIVSIIIVILTISGCYLYYYLNRQQENIRLLVDSLKNQVQMLLPLYADQMKSRYSARIVDFVEHGQTIAPLLAARDLKGLYAAALPDYSLLRREDSYFERIDFIMPDGTVFLSMQDPDVRFSGDTEACIDVNTPAAEENRPIGGFVHGKCGLIYSVLLPVFYEGSKVGAVQFGISFGAFIEDIRDSLGIRTALAITDENHTEGALFPQKITSAKYTLYPFGDPLFTGRASEIDIFLDEQKISTVRGSEIVFPSYIIRNRNGDEIGRLLQAANISAISGSYRAELFRLVLVTIAVIVAASVILYWNFDKVRLEMVKLNASLRERFDELKNSEQKLETIVADRTEELEKTNLQLQQEINMRRDANLSLSRSIEEWQSTFDAITDPVTILDKDLEVVIANKAAHKLLARSESEIVGKKCHELFFGGSAVCESCPAKDIEKTGEQRRYEIDHPYLGKTLLVTCAPIQDGKDFLGYVHTARDVTEEKKLKKQLVQAQKMEAIATLAGGIAHDFNNILGAILGNADLLLYRLTAQDKENGGRQQEPVPYEDIESHLEAIKKAGNRAKDLVSQILAFSRQGKSQRQNVDISPVIKEGIKLLRSSLPANIEIRSEIDPEICQVHADLSQVHQVFMNLCTNAAQAMAEKGGVLDVAIRHVNNDHDRQRFHNLKTNQRYVALAVKDTGHGMSPEVMERIFDPFFTTRDVSEGTGMGLSVIHGIITAHDGEIDVQSEEGVGSEFTVFLPCVDTKKEATEDVVLGVPRGSEKILFVDDEEEILRMSARMLEYLGYTVQSATSGEEALSLLTKESVDVDLIITDYSMPGITGVQLAKELLDSGINIPVILCSGFSDSVILEQEARRGIKKFMSKPLDMKKLAVTIREVLMAFRG